MGFFTSDVASFEPWNVSLILLLYFDFFFLLFFLLPPPLLLLLLLFVLLLLALQSLLNLSLYHNCPPLLSNLLLTFPVPQAHLLQIFLNWLKSPLLRFSYTSSVFWFENSKLSARIHHISTDLYRWEIDPVPRVRARGWHPGPVWMVVEILFPDGSVRSEPLYRLIYIGPRHAVSLGQYRIFSNLIRTLFTVSGD